MIYKGYLKLGNKQYLRFELINGRGVKLWGEGIDLQEVITAGKITELVYEDSFSVKVGESFSVNISTLLIGVDKFKTIYEVDYIFKNPNNYILYSIPRALATYFLLPFIFDSFKTCGYKTYLINAYIGDAYNEPDLTNHLFVQYRFFPFTAYYNLETFAVNNPAFVKNYDPDKTSCMFVYTLPERWAADISLLKAGKYSEISEAAKERILQFHGAKKQSKLGHIIYKSTARRKQLELSLGVELSEDIELFDKPTHNTEIFNYGTHKI